jgi:hypothetical protein
MKACMSDDRTLNCILIGCSTSTSLNMENEWLLKSWLQLIQFPLLN